MATVAQRLVMRMHIRGEYSKQTDADTKTALQTALGNASFINQLTDTALDEMIANLPLVMSAGSTGPLGIAGLPGPTGVPGLGAAPSGAIVAALQQFISYLLANAPQIIAIIMAFLGKPVPTPVPAA
jgi:hypothetical protein